jgi:hypothetical protein
MVESRNVRSWNLILHGLMEAEMEARKWRDQEKQRQEIANIRSLVKAKVEGREENDWLEIEVTPEQASFVRGAWTMVLRHWVS